MTNLAQFRATAKPCEDLATLHHGYFDAGKRGFIYDGDCWLQDNEDGTFWLQLHNEEWTGDRETLESILFAWCLYECPESMGMGRCAHDIYCAIPCTLERMAQAIRENVAESITGVCHLHDIADVNQVAIDVTDDDEEAAHGIYDLARFVS